MFTVTSWERRRRPGRRPGPGPRSETACRRVRPVTDRDSDSVVTPQGAPTDSARLGPSRTVGPGYVTSHGTAGPGSEESSSSSSQACVTSNGFVTYAGAGACRLARTVTAAAAAGAGHRHGKPSRLVRLRRRRPGVTARCYGAGSHGHTAKLEHDVETD